MLKKLNLFCLWISLLGGHLTAYEFSIATMFQDEAPYFKEWIEYHIMVGAEHFWLYDNESQDNPLEILQPYIEKGIVEVIPWSKPLSETDEIEGFPATLQAEMVRDAITRARGISKWIAIIDVDEFILPKKDKTISECLENHFSEAQAVFAS